MTDECIRRPSSTFTSCTCPSCRVRKRRLAKMIRTGNLPPSRSDEAWAVIDERLEAGWSPQAVASAAGLSERTIRGGIDSRRADGVHTWSRYVAGLVLRSAEWPEHGMLPAVGVTRRLRALAALGWTLEELSGRIGMPVMTLSVIRAGRVRTTKAETHRAVREGYAALAMTPGPSATARTAARRSRWAPPLAWDDDAIDDPAAVPDYGASTAAEADAATVEQILDGRPCDTTAADRDELVPILNARGMSAGEMAALMRTSSRTVVRIRRRVNVQSRWTA